MSKLGKTIVFVTAITSLALVVFPVAAQITQLDSSDCGQFGIKCSGNETAESFAKQTIPTIINAFLVLIGIVAAIYLVLGGLRYIRSEGDEGEAEKAKNTILSAVIGIIVIGLSALIVNFAIDIVSNNGGAGGNAGTPQFPQQLIVPSR